VLCGGGRADNLGEEFKDGFFIKPTLIGGLAPTNRCSQEEIFGPVIVM